MLRRPCTAAVSAAVAFDGARHRAYVAGLDGTISAFYVAFDMEVRAEP